MTDGTQNLTVNIGVNGPAAQQSAQVLEKHRKQIEGIGEAYKSVTSSTLQHLATLGPKFDTFGERINSASKQSIEDFVAQQRAIANMGDELDKTSVKAEALRRTGGALSQLGLHEIGGLVSRAGDVIQVGQDLNKVTEQFPSLGAAASAAVAQVGPLVATLLPIAAVAGAGALALKALTDAIAAQKKMVEDTVAALKSDTDQRLANIDAIHNNTAEQIKAQIETDKAKLAEIQTEKAYRQSVLADIQKQYADLGSSFNPVQRAALGAAGDAAQKSIDDLTQRENELTTAIESNTNKVLPAIEVREREAAAVEAQQQATEDAAKSEEDLAKERDKAAKELTDIQAKEEALSKSRQGQLDQRIIDDNRASAASILQAQIAAAQEVEIEQARSQKIAQYREQGAAAEIEAQRKVAESIAKAQQSSMENQLKLLQNYINAEKRATEDHSRERIRKLQDLYASLSDLAAQRDVAGFVNTRRAGLTDISRGDEDFGVAAQRRREDYERARQEEERALRQRITDIQAAATQEAQQRAQQLAQKIQQEEAAGQKELSQSAALQKQLSDLRESWAKQDLQQRRRTEDDAFRQQMTALQQREQALTSVVQRTTQPVVNFFGSVGNAIVAMVAQVKAAFDNASAASANTVAPGGNRLSQYASGIDYVPRDMMAMLHQGEKVTRAVDNRQTNNPVISLSIGSVGENVSRREIETLKGEIVESVVHGVEIAFGRG